MRLSSYIPALAALVGAALLCVAVAMFTAARIEASSSRAVERALQTAGHDWAEVSVNGLQVFLRGTAPDEATRFQALSAAGSVVDDARVADEMQVAAAAEIAAPRFSLEILRNDAGVSLIGLIPAAMDREEMAREVARLADGAPVTDLSESASYPVPQGWAQAVDFALDVLGKLPRSKISVAADRVEIITVAESAPARRILEAELRRQSPGGIELVLNIKAPRPVISPFTLRFVLAPDGARFDACSAYSTAGRTRIETSARAAGFQGQSPCVLGLGVPSPRWANAVTAGIEGLAELGEGVITFSDADVSLVVPETTDQAAFDRVVGELESALPDVFSLTAIKPEPVVIDGTGTEETGPPEFVATLSPEGDLQLRGRVSDERQRDAVHGYAKVNFRTAEVTQAMRVDETLPDGWARRVLAGLDALSELSSGALVVQPDFVDIRGNTGDKATSGEISRILSAQLGDAANFNINVQYKEELDPLISIPTPEQCVADINAVLAAQKITFEPGSADIDGAGLGTVDKIAKVLEEYCHEVPMEISGYTDSQGREVMNLNLSQQRAEAVLAALQSRRVLTGNLTPKGYGEESPIADNGTEEGREANRRIEFTLRSAASPETSEETGTEETPQNGEAEDGQN